MNGGALLQGALSGLAAGGVYAVFAVTLTLMSRLVRVVNFAQAATGMFAAFISVWFASKLGIPVWLATIAGVIVGALLSALIGWIAATWLAEADLSTRSAMTVAPFLLLMSLSYIMFGNKPQPFAPIFDGAAFSVAGVVVSWVTVVTVSLAILVALAAAVVLRKTTIGTKLRALSDRPTTAELIGIASKPLSIGVWAVTGAVSAVTVLIIAPTQSNDAVSLSMLIIPAAAAALLGGFKRLDLAVVGGLLLGLVGGMVAQVSELTLVRSFVPLVFIVVLLLWSQRKAVWDAAR
ncbi:branched-chain amino acid ABC transporter permease [Leucobacter sp. OLJS4]|uniref:ABC transporter permease subunit n=1 Tax=unclassified Leucobacter TaxID=2621730 RepID=UPI000C1917E0|nr:MULTISPECIES: branched-chain amino acid ABC transporter permease [unclassified Leucobacter]PII83786.1 branched-chain amino acid ABC transporter permease [Leucobacter sp. OLCALW19]PII89319.1 branched-chain amino acid ABC transporter permease [Leucobacter sp. OLTLW20]PII90684.1 branched-chain amino acid ABC transporter permease [Leucobacter sp. OLAS13]PII99601.1 branched-chain amino acid ABC transporter permease [Leucobacter sp. OLDS2]PIJ01742.1 branched-chain amino acid ABC transporter perme